MLSPGLHDKKIQNIIRREQKPGKIPPFSQAGCMMERGYNEFCTYSTTSLLPEGTGGVPRRRGPVRGKSG